MYDTALATCGQQSSSSVDRQIAILGVRLTDVTRTRAVQLLDACLAHGNGRRHTVFFANAHTLNLAARDAQYRGVLNSAEYTFGDGTGVRWAARLQALHVRDNLNGTDLVPHWFHATAGRGHRYFLLGAQEGVIGRAAQYAMHNFPGWNQAGFHHGYLADEAAAAGVIAQINQARPDVLLVGMGNPRQERWIQQHRHRLHVPLCVGIGGLFDFWAQTVSRAPRWLRSAGHEWLWRLAAQPRDKARRYLLGNPLFLGRALCEAWQK